MNDVTLVIMAAGIGSRYGAGIKQLQQVGQHGEIIMDYSIHDALEAGFNKVIIIIRKDIEDEFREVIGTRIEKICPVEYVFQDKDDLPEGFSCPENRTKPWGTGQAVLACRHILHEPFAIINADDYYGKEAFHKMYKFLIEHQDTQYQYCMIGFRLMNTLSDNGGVTRGVCAMDENENLVRIADIRGIMRDEQGVVRSGVGAEIPEDSLVSMNLWGATPEFMDILQQKFAGFLEKVQPGDLKAEYLLADIVDDMLRKKEASVKVLFTPDRWFGVTYAEDKDTVVQEFKALIDAGVYGESLWGKINLSR